MKEYILISIKGKLVLFLVLFFIGWNQNLVVASEIEMKIQRIDAYKCGFTDFRCEFVNHTGKKLYIDSFPRSGKGVHVFVVSEDGASIPDKRFNIPDSNALMRRPMPLMPFRGVTRGFLFLLEKMEHSIAKKKECIILSQ